MGLPFDFPDEPETPASDDGAGSVFVSVEEPPPPARSRHTGGVVELPPTVERKPSRITVHLNEDGSIAWSKLKPSNVETLRESLKNDSYISSLFSKDHIELLTLETAATMVDAIGKINTFVFMKAFKLHPAIAIQYFTYSPEHHEKIDPQAQIVLNKYRDKLPKWMTTYQEEIQLGAVLMQVTKEQISAALLAQRRLMMQMQDEPKQEPPAPMRSNGGARVEQL